MPRRIFLPLLLLFTTPALGEVVELSNGDRLNVTIVERSDDHVTFTHPVLGEVTLPAAQVNVIEAPEATAAPAPVPAPEPTPEPEPVKRDPQLFGVRFLPGFARRFEVGVDGSEGNSETFNLHAAFMADREDETDRWHIGSVYTRKTSEGETTENAFYAELIKDWLVPGEKYFYFGQTRYDHDDFESWEHRAAAAGGVGYQFIKRDDLDLIGRVGGGGNYTWGGDASDELTPEALLGIEGAWRIDERQTFEFKNTLYPSLGDLGEFRNLTSLAYVVTLDQIRGLSLKLGLENEYESQVEAGSEHNDLKYFAAMVFEF